jgi:cell division protein FtsB
MEQMAAASDASDARNRASWVIGLIKNAAAAEAARLREENAALREQAARLHEEAAALRERAATADRDNAVLKRGVLAVLKEYM